MLNRSYRRICNQLFFDTDFNQSIDNIIWPSSINFIKFGSLFNQPIDKVKWPDTIECIIFGRNFNQSIDNLPDGLKELVIHTLYKPLLNLPITLQKLEIYFANKDIIQMSKIPFGCKIIIKKN
jgi:hypothetical protein